jgi:hypothetical protein
MYHENPILIFEPARIRKSFYDKCGEFSVTHARTAAKRTCSQGFGARCEREQATEGAETALAEWVLPTRQWLVRRSIFVDLDCSYSDSLDGGVHPADTLEFCLGLSWLRVRL